MVMLIPWFPIESVLNTTDPGWLLWAIWTLQTPSLKQFEFFKLLVSTTNCHAPKRLKKTYITFFVLPNLFQPSLASTNKGWETTCCWAWADYRCCFFFRLKSSLEFLPCAFFSRKCLERDKPSTRNFSQLLTVELPMEKTHTSVD